jgi:hypothetical protein
VPSYDFDAEGVAHICKLATPPAYDRPYHDAIDVLDWGLSQRHGPHRACSTCERWRNGIRTQETSRRPPGAVSRDSCFGCYASFFDQVDEDGHDISLGTNTSRSKGLDPAEAAERRTLMAEWRALLEQLQDHNANEHRYTSKREKDDFRGVRIKLQTELASIREVAVQQGWDPIKITASGSYINF